MCRYCGTLLQFLNTGDAHNQKKLIKLLTIIEIYALIVKALNFKCRIISVILRERLKYTLDKFKYIFAEIVDDLKKSLFIWS
ncbi:hypothetical protein NCCP133_10100 [Cytobacillus sp. NCCP-133]|nr:hypothetical protein NCCP133_10100 [Cytobacillus sp. NCCP-133]